jgi:hypothetical protein
MADLVGGIMGVELVFCTEWSVSLEGTNVWAAVVGQSVKFIEQTALIGCESYFDII